jgi:hypothetical protein
MVPKKPSADWLARLVVGCVVTFLNVSAVGSIARGQGLPSYCYDLNRSVRAVELPAEFDTTKYAWADQILSRLTNLPEGMVGDEGFDPRVIQDLWGQDSLMTLWGIAFVLTNDRLSSLTQARAAIRLYRYYRGPPERLLYWLNDPLNDPRRLEALQAIVGRVTKGEGSKMVVGIACDAAFLLLALQADSIYRKVPLLSGSTAFQILYEAYRVLDCDSRKRLEPLIHQVDPDATIRLEYIGE